MKTGTKGIDLIKTSEGLELFSYPDPASPLATLLRKKELKLTDYSKIPKWEEIKGNPWTVGYGHTGSDVVAGLTITAEEAESLLKKDLEKFERAVTKMVVVPLTQNQFDALVSFTYNLGPQSLLGSTLLKKLNNKDYEGAANEFPKWNKAQGKILRGLVSRRAKEKTLFLTA